MAIGFASKKFCRRHAQFVLQFQFGHEHIHTIYSASIHFVTMVSLPFSRRLFRFEVWTCQSISGAYPFHIPTPKWIKRVIECHGAVATIAVMLYPQKKRNEMRSEWEIESSITELILFLVIISATISSAHRIYLSDASAVSRCGPSAPNLCMCALCTGRFFAHENPSNSSMCIARKRHNS